MNNKEQNSNDSTEAKTGVNTVLADSFAFGLYCMSYEHGATHMDGTKSYRIKGGGVYSKCRTIDELYAEFEKTKANVD